MYADIEKSSASAAADGDVLDSIRHVGEPLRRAPELLRPWRRAPDDSVGPQSPTASTMSSPRPWSGHRQWPRPA